MGKKRIEVIKKIDDAKIRKVTYCKRKKGLLKKSMELSLLCDLNVFLFIYDPLQNRVIHFMSDQEIDLMHIFNTQNQREYYSNNDYEEIGGRQINENEDEEEDDGEGSPGEDNGSEPVEKKCKKKPPIKKNKQGRVKRDQRHITSLIGNLVAQKEVIPANCTQKISVVAEGETETIPEIQKTMSNEQQIVSRNNTEGHEVNTPVKMKSSKATFSGGDDLQYQQEMMPPPAMNSQQTDAPLAPPIMKFKNSLNDVKKSVEFEQPVSDKRKSFGDKIDPIPMQKAEANNSDSESISCKRSNNTSMMYSNDLYLSQKFMQKQKDNQSQYKEKVWNMKTLSEFMKLYGGHMTDKKEQLIKMFFVSLMQIINTTTNYQNDQKYKILQMIEQAIQEQQQNKQAEPNIQKLNYIMELIEQEMQQNSRGQSSGLTGKIQNKTASGQTAKAQQSFDAQIISQGKLYPGVSHSGPAPDMSDQQEVMRKRDSKLMSKQFFPTDMKAMQQNTQRMGSFTTQLLAQTGMNNPPQPMLSGPLGQFGLAKEQFNDNMTAFLRQSQMSKSNKSNFLDQIDLASQSDHLALSKKFNQKNKLVPLKSGQLNIEKFQMGTPSPQEQIQTQIKKKVTEENLRERITMLSEQKVPNIKRMTTGNITSIFTNKDKNDQASNNKTPNQNANFNQHPQIEQQLQQPQFNPQQNIHQGANQISPSQLPQKYMNINGQMVPVPIMPILLNQKPQHIAGFNRVNTQMQNINMQNGLMPQPQGMQQMLIMMPQQMQQIQQPRSEMGGSQFILNNPHNSQFIIQDGNGNNMTNNNYEQARGQFMQNQFQPPLLKHKSGEFSSNASNCVELLIKDSKVFHMINNHHQKNLNGKDANEEPEGKQQIIMVDREQKKTKSAMEQQYNQFYTQQQQQQQQQRQQQQYYHQQFEPQMEAQPQYQYQQQQQQQQQQYIHQPFPNNAIYQPLMRSGGISNSNKQQQQPIYYQDQNGNWVQFMETMDKSSFKLANPYGQSSIQTNQQSQYNQDNKQGPNQKNQQLQQQQYNKNSSYNQIQKQQTAIAEPQKQGGSQHAYALTQQQQHQQLQQQLNQYNFPCDQSNNDTMSDISKLNLTTISNINKQAASSVPREKKNPTAADVVMNGINREKQMQQGIRNTGFTSGEIKIGQRISEEIGVVDQQREQLVDKESNNKVNCSQSTINRCQNDQKQFYKWKKQQNGIKGADGKYENAPAESIAKESASFLYNQKEQVKPRKNEQKKVRQISKTAKYFFDDSKSEIVQTQNPAQKKFDDIASAKQSSVRRGQRRNSVQSQIFDPRKVIEMINKEEPIIKEHNQNKNKKNQSVNSQRSDQDVKADINSLKKSIKESIMSRASKKHLKEVQDLREDQQYQRNMLKKMDIDKISDNVSVSNTEFNHGQGMIQIPEELGYGPQAIQFLEKQFHERNQKANKAAQQALDNSKNTNLQLLADLNNQYSRDKNLRKNKVPDNIFTKSDKGKADALQEGKSSEENVSQTHSLSQSASVSANSKMSVSQQSDFRYGQFLRPQNNKNTGNFANQHYSNPNSRANSVNTNKQSRSSYRSRKYLPQVPQARQTGGFSSLVIEEKGQAPDQKQEQEIKTPQAPHRLDTNMSFIQIDEAEGQAKDQASKPEEQPLPKKMISFSMMPKVSGQIETPNGPTQSNYLQFLKQQKKEDPGLSQKQEEMNKKKRKFNDNSFLPKVMQDDLENSKSIKSNVEDTSQKSDLYSKIVGLRRVEQATLNDKKSQSAVDESESSQSALQSANY